MFLPADASYRGAESKECLGNQQSCSAVLILERLLTSLRLVVWRVSSVALAQSAGASFMTPASFTCIIGHYTVSTGSTICQASAGILSTLAPPLYDGGLYMKLQCMLEGQHLRPAE